MSLKLEGTTILSVRHKGQAAICGDGQVTNGDAIMKSTSRKVRRVHHDKIICGFAGATADAMAIIELFEEQLSKYSGHMIRAAVELTKKWRTDRGLLRLEAVLICSDPTTSLFISGVGDVIEPDEQVLATGSGGNYALAAAKALLRHRPEMSAPDIAKEALKIASEICIYTNDNFVLEVLDTVEPTAPVTKD
ncbi:MAG: ATP-dependent protease subunit HslV [Deltaproteobacteria bacterium]|jgi:ATP-dependent HslUV protease subunit HslV|nr:ATP-dependent protease subunit HslV [Deltaproteobacteria bacterium]